LSLILILSVLMFLGCSYFCCPYYHILKHSPRL